MQRESFLFLILFTISSVTLIPIQFCFDSFENASFLSLEEASSKDMFEFETEKVTRETALFVGSLAFQKVSNSTSHINVIAFWNTACAVPETHPPSQL
ncbi:MAG: hypothetical protein ACJAYD_000940 [Patiriisocius sp.]